MQVVVLLQQPGQGQLRRCALKLLAELFQGPNQLQVAIEILTLEARQLGAEVAVGTGLFNVLFGDGAREEAPSQVALSNQGNVEVLQHGQNVFFQIARPQRVLTLQGRDRVHRVRFAQGFD